MLSIVHFSLRPDGSQWRSTCVFGAYIHTRLTKFLEGSYFLKLKKR